MSPIQAKSHAQTYWYVEKTDLKPDVVRLQAKKQKLTPHMEYFITQATLRNVVAKIMSKEPLTLQSCL